MRRRRLEAALPLALGAGAFAVAFRQRPGWATSDTKINLHVAPGRFLGDVSSTWASTGGLGHVQSGQLTGYLFPMGPWFAGGNALGLSPWVVQRLWLGAVLALTAWGVVRLLDTLLGRPRGVAHAVAGAVAVLNPFVVVYANRTTVTLLALAVLPWLLLAVHRGVRDPRGWRWPAAVALLVTASGGGVNGAVTAWMLAGPALLVLYEPLFAGARWADVRGFLLRTAPLAVLASLWWLVPLAVQSGYGVDFLRFTEQPGTVWGTTSATESLRLMGFWLSYVGVGFAGRAIPYFDTSATMLFSAPVVVASLLVPALALGGFAWTRCWRYAPFFLALALVGVVAMIAGFPEGTPLRRGLIFTYYHVPAVQAFRASYKAAPLLAVGLACLAGAAAGEAWRRLPRPATRAALAAGAVALAALAAWPLVAGRAQDAQVSWKRIPAAWRAAAAGIDRDLPPASRAMVLPGELFAFYDWGGTVDPILPALSRRPVTERTIVPYGDLHATDLLTTVDGLIHQRRALPGQLRPLLRLLGVRSVVSGADADVARSGAPWPADAARALAAQGLRAPSRAYGRWRRAAARPDDVERAPVVAQVRRYDLGPGPGLVRVEPRADPVIVDGSADALAGLAAFGALPRDRVVRYAGDLGAGDVRDAARAGADVVVSDTNRRRAFVASSLERNAGPTLTAGQDVSADGLVLDPFGRGPDAQTVAVLHGVRSLDAPSSPQIRQSPERRPYAAFDGDAATAWVPDRTLDPSRWRLTVGFDRARDVGEVVVTPAGGLRAVEVDGRRLALAAGRPRRLDLGLRGATGLDVRAIGPRGGVAEIAIPGVRAREELRLPRLATGALAGRDLARTRLTYLFARTTGDAPYEGGGGDAERGLARTFAVPAARSFAADAWVGVAASAPDDAVDRLAGTGGALHATSSGRHFGRPGRRASRAFDGDPATAWIGDTAPAGRAWLRWRSPREMRVARLTLVAPRERTGVPARVRLSWRGGLTGALAVGRDGAVALPRPVRARSLRLDVLAVRGGAATRTVGIAEVRGVRGLPRPQRGGAAVTTGCAAVRLRVGARPVGLRVAATRADFEGGQPLRARGCGAPVALPAGQTRLTAVPGTFLVDRLRLRSPAPRPGPAAAPAGRVLDPGDDGRGRRDGVRVRVQRPAWLVLAESHNRGWRATCDGRDLGGPEVVDGFANGWRVAPGCRAVTFAFAPDRAALAGYAVALLAGVLCIVLLVVPRHRAAGVGTLAPAAQTEPGQSHWPARRAAVAAVGAGAVLGFVFGAGVGVPAVPAAFAVLRLGVGARPLALAAGALLAVVVPLLYLAHPGDRAGADHFGYASAHLGAHWVGVGAIVLLLGALYRALSEARGP